MITKEQQAELARVYAHDQHCGLLGCGWENRQTIARECVQLGLLNNDGSLTEAGVQALKESR